MLISNPQDSHTWHLFRELKKDKNVTADLFFPELAGKYLRFNISNYFTSCSFSQNSIVNELNDYYSIWFRRPRPILPQITGLDRASVEGLDFARREWDSFLQSIYSMCTKPKWISHPDNIFYASRKLLQLSTAKKIGFLVPDSILTNDPEEAKSFFAKHNCSIVAKAVGIGYFYDKDGNPQGVYTTLISNESTLVDEQIYSSPVIFQEYIKKIYEIRVTIIEDQLFAAKIVVTGNQQKSVDWRQTPEKNIKYFPCELPMNQANLCYKLLKEFGLKYGAIDLLVDLNGSYYFLEINPNGQYYWLERNLGLPITQAIINSLTK